MPSGFQQDTNQLQPNFYRVAIDMSDTTTKFPTTDLGNKQDGGCTPNTWDFFAVGSLPTTAAKAMSRARGNLRFRSMINGLTGLGDCQILDVTITEANGDAQATALTFTVKYERDSFIPLTGTYQGATAVGNDVAGNAMNTVAKVIANTVALGLYTGITELGRVYNPTTGEGTELPVTANAGGTAAAILGVVTVSLIDTTTVVNA
jgi:hypothetical protein